MSNNELIEKIIRWVKKNSSEVKIDIGFDILDIEAIEVYELVPYLESLKTK